MPDYSDEVSEPEILFLFLKAHVRFLVRVQTYIKPNKDTFPSHISDISIYAYSVI